MDYEYNIEELILGYCQYCGTILYEYQEDCLEIENEKVKIMNINQLLDVEEEELYHHIISDISSLGVKFKDKMNKIPVKHGEDIIAYNGFELLKQNKTALVKKFSEFFVEQQKEILEVIRCKIEYRVDKLNNYENTSYNLDDKLKHLDVYNVYKLLEGMEKEIMEKDEIIEDLQNGLEGNYENKY